MGASADSAWFSPEFVQGAARVPGVRRVSSTRFRSLLLDPALPPLTLLAREFDGDTSALPLVGTARPAPPGTIPIYVSEAVVDLYHARAGTAFAPLAQAFPTNGPRPVFFVAGVWRDYVRQTGAVLLDQRDYLRLTGDTRVNEAQLPAAGQA